MSASSSTNDAEISPETSKRVCTHMNEDHAVSVYAMAKSLMASEEHRTDHNNNHHACRLTDATMTSVTLSACHMRAILCSGDTCEMKNLEYAFEPPLASATELRPRLVAIHHAVCRPNIAWLWIKPVCRFIIPASAILLYLTFVVRIDKLVSLMEAHADNALTRLLMTVYGSARNFGKAVAFGAWFIVIAHSAEAAYVFYHAIKTLKLKQETAILWYILVCMVGYPITLEFVDLLKVHWKTQASKKKD